MEADDRQSMPSRKIRKNPVSIAYSWLLLGEFRTMTQATTIARAGNQDPFGA